jgi:hypothetical protein
MSIVVEKEGHVAVFSLFLFPSQKMSSSSSSLGFNFGVSVPSIHPTATSVAVVSDGSERDAKKKQKKKQSLPEDGGQVVKKSFDAELDGFFKKSVAFVPPQVHYYYYYDYDMIMI